MHNFTTVRLREPSTTECEHESGEPTWKFLFPSSAHDNRKWMIFLKIYAKEKCAAFSIAGDEFAAKKERQRKRVVIWYHFQVARTKLLGKENYWGCKLHHYIDGCKAKTILQDFTLTLCLNVISWRNWRLFFCQSRVDDFCQSRVAFEMRMLCNLNKWSEKKIITYCITWQTNNGQKYSNSEFPHFLLNTLVSKFLFITTKPRVWIAGTF